jgi:hypothetical protein
MFRLCLAIGGDRCIHPDELERYLNRRQIFEWMAYARLFPFGDERDDYRTALQTFWLRASWLEEAGEPADYMAKFDNAGPKSEAQLIVDEILESL